MKRKIAELVLLNVGLAAVYFYFFSQLNLPVDSEYMYSTPDAQSYEAVALWWYGIPTQATSIRPLLYPMINVIGWTIAGFKGVWSLQILFWIGAGNFLFLAVRNYSRNTFVSFIAATVYALNLSLVAATLHALTEVTTAFLLSILIWLASKHPGKFTDTKFHAKILFVVALLVVTKPLFYPLFLIELCIALVIFIRKKVNITQIGFLLLASLPVMLQLSFMKYKHDEFTISKISDITYHQYLVTDTYAELIGGKRNEVDDFVFSWTPHEVDSFTKEHRMEIFLMFAKNIGKNLVTGSPFLTKPIMRENKEWSPYTRSYNWVARNWHNLFLWLVPAFVLLYMRRRQNHWMLPLLASFVLTWYIFVTSGISGWQGDRLILCALPLWIFCYTTLLAFQLSVLRNMFILLQRRFFRKLP